MWISSCLSTIYSQDFSFPFKDLGILVENQLTIEVYRSIPFEVGIT